MKEPFLSLLEVAELEGKTYTAVKHKYQRGAYPTARQFNKKQALERGLPWRKDGGTGRKDTRPFILLSDPGISSAARLRHLEALSMATPNQGCSYHTTQAVTASATMPPQSAACDPALNPPEREPEGETLSLPISAPSSGVPSTAGDIEQLSDSEIDRELYAEIPKYNRRKADKYVTILSEMRDLHGAELKIAIGEWNRNHPDYRTSYPRVMEARKTLDVQGYLGLMAQYGKSSQTTVREEWFQIFKGLFLKEGGPSVFSCWVTTLGEVHTSNQEINAQSFPSVAAFRRLLKKRVPESTIYFYRHGYQKWRRKYGAYVDRDYSDILCGQVYVSDHAQWDVAVRTPEGDVCFPWITAVSDFKSGKYVGWINHPESPNTDHILGATFQAFNNYGIPEAFIIDNGKDYRSRDFSGGRKAVRLQLDEVKAGSLLIQCEVTPHFALPHNPPAKPIERSFLKNKEWLSKHMPGYRGGNITERPEALKDEIKQGRILEWAEFEKIAERYVEGILNRMPSNGKNLKGMCPDELWEREVTVVKKASPGSLKMLCMRSSRTFTIEKNGIKDGGATYWGEWMSAHKGEKVYMRRDKKLFPEIAWVFTTDEGAKERYLGEAKMPPRTSALATSDSGRAAVKDAITRVKHDLSATKLASGRIDRPKAQDLITFEAVGVSLLNEKRGYRPGQAQEPVIRPMSTPADEVIRERERQAKAGTCDLSQIAPPSKPRKERKIFAFMAEKKRYEQEQSDAQNL